MMKRLKLRKSNALKAIVFVVVLITISMLYGLNSSNIKASDLTAGITPNTVDGKAIDDQFIENTAAFSIDLFKESANDSENILISPLSVMLALAMTANGADNETLAQMETVLGKDIPLDELNQYLYAYVKNLPGEEKAKLDIANSIWFRDDEDNLTVEEGFLQTNADYYHAQIYKAAFDDRTVRDINNWVEDNTDGMIDQIVDSIGSDVVMYLINALAFEAEWQHVYEKNDIYDGEFTAIDGDKQDVEFMRSGERLYLDDGMATGFIKPYYDGKYSFVALLPNEGVSLTDYIASLSGEGFVATVKNAENTAVKATLPKFSYDYSITMNDVLIELGMPQAFSQNEADFSNLGQSSYGNIFISRVLHKTFISVDELGTKAGAVTAVEMETTAAPSEDIKIVILDRPFVYAIIDNTTGLPVFIGSVTSFE